MLLCCFWFLFLLAAAMNFSYLYIRSPNRKTPWKKSPPGGETPCLWRTEKPQNCTPKMPNVTSETHRKWCFWLLFPLAAAMNFSYPYIRSPNRLLLLLPAAAAAAGGCCCCCYACLYWLLATGCCWVLLSYSLTRSPLRSRGRRI